MPQCWGVVFGSKHTPPQNACPTGHWQLPAKHCWPPLQTGLQGGGAGAHCPCWQVKPAGQTFPHAPQLAASLAVSTQPVAQTFRLPGHTHAPAMQAPVPQLRLHAPQLRGSTLMSIQPPPQSNCPGVAQGRPVAAPEPALVTMLAACSGPPEIDPWLPQATVQHASHARLANDRERSRAPVYRSFTRCIARDVVAPPQSGSDLLERPRRMLQTGPWGGPVCRSPRVTMWHCCLPVSGIGHHASHFRGACDAAEARPFAAVGGGNRHRHRRRSTTAPSKLVPRGGRRRQRHRCWLNRPRRRS
jgi:hypothetical protein